LNSPPPTDFTIALLNPDGTLSSSVNLSTFVKLDGPVGSATVKNTPRYHPILQTARIPLAAFSSVALSAVRGVRLQFSISPSGYIAVTNIRASRNVGSMQAAAVAEAPQAFRVVAAAPSTPNVYGVAAPSTPEPTVQADVEEMGAERTAIRTGNRVVGIRRAAAGQVVAIELRSDTAFQPRDAPLVLVIGTSTFRLSAHPQGDLHRVVFKLSSAEWDGLSDGASVSVQYDRDAQVFWDFGRLEKSRLNR
jgi:hypothetical protein